MKELVEFEMTQAVKTKLHFVAEERGGVKYVHRCDSQCPIGCLHRDEYFHQKTAHTLGSVVWYKEL